MTTDAKVPKVFFHLPFELCVHNLLHNWSFIKPNSVQCLVSLLILPYILFYSLIFVMGESIPGMNINWTPLMKYVNTTIWFNGFKINCRN